MLRLSEIAEREEEEEKGRNNTSIWRGTRKEYIHNPIHHTHQTYVCAKKATKT